MSLKSLVIANSRITRIDALAFNGLVFLIKLVLSGNFIAAYEDFVFSAAPSLKICDFRNVHMTMFHIKAFIGLDNMTTLMLNNNNFTSILYFETANISVLPNLRKLHLEFNKIVSIREALETQNMNEDRNYQVCHITELYLDHNLIASLTANSFIRFPWLRILTIPFNLITTIDSATFSGLQHLKSLDVSQNPIKVLTDGAFSPLHWLISLYITHAELEEINAKSFINLTNLQDLHLDYNKLKNLSFFTYGKHGSVSILPNLTSISLASNNLRDAKLKELVGLPNLQTLMLDINNLTIREKFLEKLPNLQELQLTKSYVILSARGLNSSSLTRISMNESYIDTYKYDTFEEARSLRILHMPKCKQNKLSTNRQTFRNLAHLEILDLSDTGIIPDDNTFKNSTNIRYLNLNGNRLLHLDRSIFEQMTRLKSLHLKDTGLITVNYTSLPEHVRNTLTEIDLSLNPYSCLCNIVWFRHWLNTANITILNSKDYKCEFPEDLRGKSIQTLREHSDVECFSLPVDWATVSFFLFLFISCLVSLVVSLLYRYRWHVRYWQSILTTKRRKYNELQDQREYQFDAFVMYSQEDSPWVIHKLRPRLENEEHLRLCIHHRDWLGGRDITENITESIENSRKCLLIVSNAFAASNWCHVELSMAQSRLFHEDRDNLVLIVLEEITAVNLTPRLHLQMQRQTYIEWTDSPVGQQVFWARLVQALRGPSQSVTNSPLPQNEFVEFHQQDEDE